MGSAPDLDEIAEAGEYKHGTVSEKQETFTPAKYGKMFSISREALKNARAQAGDPEEYETETQFAIYAVVLTQGMLVTLGYGTD